MNAKPQGGSTANTSGQTGERILNNLLDARGYAMVDKTARDQIIAACRSGFRDADTLEIGHYVVQAPWFKSVYEVPFRADAIVRRADGVLVLFENKWQSSTGSVDEKLPFWLASLDRLGPDVITVLCLLGDGQRRQAIEWCERETKGTHIVSSFAKLKKLIDQIL